MGVCFLSRKCYEGIQKCRGWLSYQNIFIIDSCLLLMPERNYWKYTPLGDGVDDGLSETQAVSHDSHTDMQDLQTDIYHLSHASTNSIKWMDRNCHSSSQKLWKEPRNSLYVGWMCIVGFLNILYIFSFRNKMVWVATSLCLENSL